MKFGGPKNYRGPLTLRFYGNQSNAIQRHSERNVLRGFVEGPEPARA